jgi:hypothetical protein
VTAEPIAAVVADICAGRVDHPAGTDLSGKRLSAMMLGRAQLPQPVVDCTAILDAQRHLAQIDMYDDYPQITPPWNDVMLAYVNTFQNVYVLQVHRIDWDGTAPTRDLWHTDNQVDWPRVRWVAETSIWIGGRAGDGHLMPTSGPCHVFRHAIHDDGTPADINWLALLAPRGQFGQHGEIDDNNQRVWDMAMVTLGASLNFLNAANVDIAEPFRSRPTRRRLARTGVTVQTIVVRPPGKRRIGGGGARPIDASEAVFSPVRGHFARYGVEGREGLLFGKYAGKFWVPSHVRGADDADPKDYVLRPRTADNANQQTP